MYIQYLLGVPLTQNRLSKEILNPDKILSYYITDLRCWIFLHKLSHDSLIMVYKDINFVCIFF